MIGIRCSTDGPSSGPRRGSTNGTNAAIDPQLFTDGLATLGGGDITVSAAGNISGNGSLNFLGEKQTQSHLPVSG